MKEHENGLFKKEKGTNPQSKSAADVAGNFPPFFFLISRRAILRRRLGGEIRERRFFYYFITQSSLRSTLGESTGLFFPLFAYLQNGSHLIIPFVPRAASLPTRSRGSPPFRKPLSLNYGGRANSPLRIRKSEEHTEKKDGPPAFFPFRK